MTTAKKRGRKPKAKEKPAEPLDRAALAAV